MTDVQFEYEVTAIDPSEVCACLRCRLLPATVRVKLWERVVELCCDCAFKFSGDVHEYHADPFTAVENLIKDLTLSHSPIGGTA
jgi:hypothetical protein